MDVLAYTFRTNPFRSALEEQFGSAFVFGKMREDLERFKAEFTARPRALIVGFAKSWDASSYIEAKALNRFSGNRVLETGGPAQLDLALPQKVEPPFKVNRRGSDSFCNWAMYRIGSFIANQPEKVEHMFYHCHEEDIDAVARILTTMRSS